jgi:sugar phosphate permease
LRGVEIGLLSPVAGLLVDAWGARKLIICGAVITGTGLILLSRVNSLAMFYGAFTLIAAGGSTCSHTVMMTAVSNWFRKKLSLAMGVMASGVAFAGLVIPVVAVLIDWLGWRNAMVVAGFSTWAIVIPISLVIRHKPEQYGYRPDGEESDPDPISNGAGPVREPEGKFKLREVITSRTFWHIALAFALYAFVVSAIVTHVMPYLSSVGINRTAASLVASAIPLVSIVGRLSFGWFGDRVNKTRLTVAGFIMMGIALILFNSVNSNRAWLLLIFLILYGIGWGGNVPLRGALFQEYLGRARFGTIYGSITGVMMVGNIAGAPTVGWVFDTWGGYQGVWTALAVVIMVAMIVISTTPKPRHQ